MTQIIITVQGVDSSFKEIKEALCQVGEKLGMEIWVQRKEIFDNMHNV